ELRGPLTLIRGYNSMLEDGAIPPERIPQVARLLEGRLAQIDLLVEQMLEMARLEHDRVQLHLESFDLRQLTLEEIRKFQSGADGGKQEHFRHGSRPLPVSGDRASSWRRDRRGLEAQREQRVHFEASRRGGHGLT